MQAIGPPKKDSDFEGWARQVSRICGPLQAIPSRERPFRGGAELRRVSDVALIRHKASIDWLSWTDRQIADIRYAYCYVILQMAPGTLTMEQNDNSVVLHQFEWTIVDSMRPAKFEFEGDFDILAINIPRDLIASRSKINDIPFASQMGGLDGGSAIFGEFAKNLYLHAPKVSSGHNNMYRDNIVDLLLSSLPGDFELSGLMKESALAKAKRVIDENLFSHDLSPGWIAREIGVSVRHLHRAFAHDGRSVGDWVRQRRLESARCDLGDQRYSDASITEIAYCAGFNDSAHFSRAFRYAFGVSPREYRKQVLPTLSRMSL